MMGGGNGHREMRAICGICSAGCWIVATLDDEGRLISVRPDEGTPMGIICRMASIQPKLFIRRTVCSIR